MAENNENKKTKKLDFVEIKYTGYANNEIFDSNVLEDLKKINSEATEVQKTIVVIGEGMVVPGLDKSLEDREYNKVYEIEFSPREGFGERDRNLIRTIPLKAFSEQKVNPRPGMIFTLDNAVVKILAVSGARVIVDFNNPLSGKNIKYKFEIVRKVEDEKEKAEVLFNLFFRFVPKYEINENSFLVKGPKNFEIFVNAYKEKFKRLIGKELEFKEFTKEELDEELKKHEERHKHEHSHDEH